MAAEFEQPGNKYIDSVNRRLTDASGNAREMKRLLPHQFSAGEKLEGRFGSEAPDKHSKHDEARRLPAYD